MPSTKNRNVLTKFLSSSDLTLNTEQRTIGFSFSSKSNICERYAFTSDLPEGSSYVYDEYLSHDSSAWDLTRVINNTCPFLRNHTRGQKLGIVKNVTLDGEKGIALVKLSKNALADQFMSDIEDGTSGGISFGYCVEEYKVISPAEYSEDKGYRELTKKALLEATKILLLEISSEDIPADPTVGYNKSGVILQDVIIKGDPNFYPKTTDMNEEHKTLELELQSVKSALAESSAKQQILTAENDRLAAQIKQLESVVQEKSELISQFEKKEVIASRYYDLRQKAEDLVSQAKLSGSEFNDLFAALPSDDIASYTKSQSDKLGHIQFHLELIEKRAAPLLNLQQSTKDEPIVDETKPDTAAIEAHAEKLLQTLRHSPITI